MLTSISISNNGFESQNVKDGKDISGAPTGWELSGSKHTGGVRDPKSSEIGSVSGENIGWLAADGSSKISQGLDDETYDSSKQYTFSVDIGNPYYYGSMNYKINLYADNQLIGTASGTTGGSLDDLQTVELISTVSNSALNGEKLTFEIESTNNTSGHEYLYFDNVQGSFDNLPDGIIDGTVGDDDIDIGYVDAGGDIVDGADGLDDVIEGYGGDDTINAGLGADTVQGGEGDDQIAGGDGDDVLIGDDPVSPYQPLGDSFEYSYAQSTNGYEAHHFGDLGKGGKDDPMLLFDGNPSTELRIHYEDIIELSFGQILAEGTSITLTEGSSNDADGNVIVLVSFGSTDPDGDDNRYGGGGVGYENAVNNGQSVQVYSGPSNSNEVIVLPINATHIQFIGNQHKAHGGWGEAELTELLGGKPPPVVGTFDDTIDGGDGDDFIDGAQGDDVLSGGDDDDTFAVSSGIDTIDGGEGNDTYDSTGGAPAGEVSSNPDEVINVTVASSGVDDAGPGFGSGTVAKVNDGNTDTFTSIEVFVGGDAGADIITIQNAVQREDVLNLNDNAVGTFTPDDGGPVIAFGGLAQPKISAILAGASTGNWQVTSGDESGTIGNIEFDNFEIINFDVTCFAAGTHILTKAGEVLVEEITAGDMVLTMDNNYQAVRWIGSQKLDIIDFTNKPKLRPVCITSGVLGHGMPKTDLTVSPQHRVLVRSVIAERIFNTSEVLIPAIKLTELDGIYQDEEATEVNYFHLLFDSHEIIFSNGAPTESLFTGVEALKSLSKSAREEITTIFPKIMAQCNSHSAARHIPNKGKLMKQLVSRHIKNGKVLVSDKPMS